MHGLRPLPLLTHLTRGRRLRGRPADMRSMRQLPALLPAFLTAAAALTALAALTAATAVAS